MLSRGRTIGFKVLVHNEFLEREETKMDVLSLLPSPSSPFTKSAM